VLVRIDDRSTQQKDIAAATRLAQHFSEWR